MEGISRGTTLGGRYEIGVPLGDRDGVQQWVAKDTTLNREVTITAFAAAHPYADAALDSARRVAGVEDRRLGRVLDVGQEGGSAYVVTEALHHSDSLAVLLRHGTLPAEEVRRLIGESASALETARQRGLHHLVLTPHHVLRGKDGSVQVSGVALGAALAGRDDDSGDRASRDDAVALVQAVYAGLTTRWPGDDEVPGVESVPRRADGQLPSPGELVTRVPGDLDTLCRTTLNDDEGPRTPGELARQLSPWSADQVSGPGGQEVVEDAQDDESSDHTSRSAGRAAAGLGAGVAGGAAATRPSSRRGTFSEVYQDEDETMVGRHPGFDEDETSTIPVARAGGRPHRRHEDDDEELAPPLPLLSTGTEEPDRDSSRLALAIVAAVVVLALVLGFLGLRGLFGSNDPQEPQAGTSPSSSGASAPSSSKSATTAPPAPLPVSSITSYDPEGDDNEHSEWAPLAIDGKPDTTWRTHIYGSERFGRTKDGAGLLLDLGSAKDVRSVKFQIKGAPTKMTVYVGNEKSRESARELGKVDGTGDQTATATSPVKGRYVLVWITALSKEGGRQYRNQIAEIQVMS